MPRQLFNKDDLIKLADGARVCLVVRRDDKVKIKIRRSRLMYTYITDKSDADQVLKEIKLDKINL